MKAVAFKFLYSTWLIVKGRMEQGGLYCWGLLRCQKVTLKWKGEQECGTHHTRFHLISHEVDKALCSSLLLVRKVNSKITCQMTYGTITCSQSKSVIGKYIQHKQDWLRCYYCLITSFIAKVLRAGVELWFTVLILNTVVILLHGIKPIMCDRLVTNRSKITCDFFFFLNLFEVVKKNVSMRTNGFFILNEKWLEANVINFIILHHIEESFWGIKASSQSVSACI